jgi:hypothetical protein
MTCASSQASCRVTVDKTLSDSVQSNIEVPRESSYHVTLLSDMAQSCHLRSRLPAAAASFAWRELDAVQVGRAAINANRRGGLSEHSLEGVARPSGVLAEPSRCTGE